MAAAVAAEDQKLVERDKAAGKIEVIDWSQEDRNELREVAREQWEIYAQKSSLAQEALDANIAYMKEIGLLQN